MAVKQDIRIRQGETLSLVLTHRNGVGVAVDLSGYTARMSIKKCFDDSAIAFLTTGGDADGGTLTLGGVAGTITVAMTADESRRLITDVDISALVPPEKRRRLSRDVVYQYDLELTDGSGNVTRAFEGAVVVQRNITP